MGQAVERIGLKFFPLQLRNVQIDGGEYFPSRNVLVIIARHFAHKKSICTTSGRTILTLTTVPRTETSLPVNKHHYH